MNGLMIVGLAIVVFAAAYLGYGRWLHGAGDVLVVIRNDEGHKAPALDSIIHVTPRADRLHFFDAETGKRL